MILALLKDNEIVVSLFEKKRNPTSFQPTHALAVL
jgi:hypothetical protein